MKRKLKNLLQKIVLSNVVFTSFALFVLKRRLQKKSHLKTGKNVFIGPSTICEGYNFLGSNTSATSCHFGFGSYLAENSILKKTKVGRYTSIGPEVRTVEGKHPSSNFVSTHPAFFSTRKQVGFSYTDKQLFQEFADFRDSEKKYSTIIGNDVWIGARVLIMDGVKIGDGAIVAAGSVVVKDIEPYAIVGGVPAKTIKSRFAQDQKAFLMDFRWWEKGEDWIKTNSIYFTDVNQFIKQFGHAAN